jgi:trigger factor
MMDISVEVTSQLARRMTVGVPKERVENEVQDRLKSLARTSRIHGFRPGKVPLRVIQQRYGGQVRQEVVAEVIKTSFQQAVEEKNLRPAGMPDIELLSNQTENELKYTAAFEVYPEITGVTLDGINAERLNAEIGEADIDKMIETLRKQRVTLEKVERPAQNGDSLTVSSIATCDGQAFNELTGSNLRVNLGQNYLPPEFDQNLLGMSEGQHKEFDARYPADYSSPALAGKTVHFQITVQSVSESRLPEVNDEFAASFGVEEGGVEALRAGVKQNMERELRLTLKNHLKQQILNGLQAANPLEVPQALIQQEAQRLLKNMESDLQENGAGGVTLSPEMFTGRAESRVKLGLLVGELVRANGLRAPSEKVREMVETVASTYENPQMVIRWFYEDRNRLAEVEATVLEEQAVDWILQRIAVTDKTISFEEAMQTKDSQGKKAE